MAANVQVSAVRFVTSSIARSAEAPSAQKGGWPFCAERESLRVSDARMWHGPIQMRPMPAWPEDVDSAFGIPICPIQNE